MKFWIRKFLRNFKEILLLKRRSLKEINEIFSYLRYKKFFSGNNKIHELKLIAPKDASIPNFKIDQISAGENRLTFNTFFLEKGMYILRVTSESKILSSKKFVKAY